MFYICTNGCGGTIARHEQGDIHYPSAGPYPQIRFVFRSDGGWSWPPVLLRKLVQHDEGILQLNMVVEYLVVFPPDGTLITRFSKLASRLRQTNETAGMFKPMVQFPLDSRTPRVDGTEAGFQSFVRKVGQLKNTFYELVPAAVETFWLRNYAPWC